MQYSFKLLFILIFLISGVSIIFFPYFHPWLPKEKKDIVVDGKQYTAWVADDEQERERGLQWVIGLKSNQGMLFIFSLAGRYCFWNKNTLVPLRLIFFYKGDMVDEKNLASIWRGRQTICPDKNVDQILEIPMS